MIIIISPTLRFISMAVLFKSIIEPASEYAGNIEFAML